MPVSKPWPNAPVGLAVTNGYSSVVWHKLMDTNGAWQLSLPHVAGCWIANRGIGLVPGRMAAAAVPTADVYPSYSGANINDTLLTGVPGMFVTPGKP